MSETYTPDLPAEATLLTPAEALVESAKALVIDSPVMLKIALDEVQGAKVAWQRLDDQEKAITRPQLAAIEAARALFRKPKELCKAAETAIKAAMSAYNLRIEDERRRAQAVADEKLRKEAEKIEQQAVKAEAAGKIEKADALHATAASMPTAVVLPATEKVAGLSEATLYDGEGLDILATAAFIVANPVFKHLLKYDQMALRAQARAMKDAFNIPGCKLVKTASVRVRAAA